MAAAEDTPQPLPLVPGTTLEGHLAADIAHEYQAALGAGPWRLLVAQHGGDALITLVPPTTGHRLSGEGGERLGPFDSPSGRRGVEAVFLHLEEPGTLGVKVRPRSKSSAGRYSITLERLSDPAIAAESAATAAGLAYADGEKEEARIHYEKALALWPPSETAGRARTLSALATLARWRGEPREAIRFYRQALPLWRSLGDLENEATVSNRLGLTLDRLGESAEARRLFVQTLALWQTLGDRPAEALQRNNLCLALQRQGEMVEARACYLEARRLFQQLDDPVRETIVLSNLAGVHWKLGESERALAAYDEALSASRARGHHPQAARTLVNRALLYTELGEVEKAFGDYDRALRTFRQLADRRMEGTVLTHLGKTYLDLGDDERARSLLEQALALRREAEDRRGVATILRLLGKVYGRLGDWPGALDAYGEALATSVELEDHRGTASLWAELGRAHAAQGSLPRAATELERAAEFQHQLGDRRLEARALLELGVVRYRTGKREAALTLFGRALEVFRTVGDRGEEARTLEARARTLRAMGRPSAALDDVRSAAQQLEDLRTQAGGLRQRATFLATRRGVYELHIDLLMEQHRAEPRAGHHRQAFAVSERSRSRALLDLLRNDAGLDDDLRHAVRAATHRLTARIENQMNVLAAQPPSSALPPGGAEPDHHTTGEVRITEAERGVYEALADLERLRAKARRTSPGYAELSGESTLDAAAVPALLEPGTLLLEVALGEVRSIAWALTSKTFTSFELPPRPELESLARQAHADLSTLDLRTGSTSRHASTRLGRLLLGPVTHQLAEARRLALVVDGALNIVPFAALPHDDGEPLVTSHEVVQLPSASALATLRRRPPSSPGKTIAVLADPVFRAPSEESGESRAEESRSETPERLRGHLGDLERLPATRREAQAIVALVPPSESLLALGHDAHRDRVLGGELADYRYLHFATHGLLNTHHPELSGIVLARFDAEGVPRNGFLSMDDVVGLELAAELVVLSGCQTALGRELRGEGLLGLGRGFMAAGCRESSPACGRCATRPRLS